MDHVGHCDLPSKIIALNVFDINGDGAQEVIIGYVLHVVQAILTHGLSELTHE